MWEKFKLYFKKYWGYIVAFILGILSYIGIDYRRTKRFDEHLSELKHKLHEYQIINEQLRTSITELEQRIESITDTSEQAVDNHEQLAIDIRQARENADDIAKRVDDTIKYSYTINTVTDKLSTEFEGIDSGIQQLKEFIKKYGTTN